MLTYYNPVNTADRYSDRRYAKTGKKLSPGMREEIMQNQKDRGERKLEAGIPSHLMYAHHDYPPMLEARMKIPEEKLDLLPYEAHERNKIADLQDIAPKIGMHPRAVYNNQRMFSQMIPEEFTMRDSEPDDIQPSPIPGMVYINGELVSDPRIKNTSEPMDYAWSELLKRETPKTMAARRKREKRSEFRQCRIVVLRQSNLCRKTLHLIVLTWVNKKQRKFLVAHELFGHLTHDMVKEVQEPVQQVVDNSQVYLPVKPVRCDNLHYVECDAQECQECDAQECLVL